MGKRVVIRVHYDGGPVAVRSGEAEDDFEHALVDFVQNVTEKMGYPAEVRIAYREDNKIGLRLESKHSNILIGRKGKNLDAIQLLANVVAGKLDHDDIKVVVDAENYRSRREESLIRLAQKVGDEVKRSHGSKLLEPMNPFERRLIHTTLNDVAGIATRSEGDGLYKQVRVYYQGAEER
jgi:spoIIIJ-associated protein